MNSLSFSNNNLTQIFFALLPDMNSGQNIGKREKLAEIQDLLKFGVDVNAELHSGYTVLCKVIEDGGSKSLVELLLNYGARIDVPKNLGVEWEDIDGQLINSQVYALAKQRQLRLQDKESLEIQQLIHKHLIQNHMLNTHKVENMHTGQTIHNAQNVQGIQGIQGIQAAQSTQILMQQIQHAQQLQHPGLIQQQEFVQQIASPQKPILQEQSLNKSHPLRADMQVHSQETTSHLAMTYHPAVEDVIKKKIFIFDFDNTMVNGHFHNILKNMGVANGRASQELIEFLLEKYGIRNKEFLVNIFRDILNGGDCISIASSSRYPETIIAALSALGLTEEERSKIFYDPPDLKTPLDLTMGKNVDILKAMIYFEVIDVNAVYLIDHDSTNLQLAKSRLNIPESNLIKIESDPENLIMHLRMIQKLVRRNFIHEELKRGQKPPSRMIS